MKLISTLFTRSMLRTFICIVLISASSRSKAAPPVFWNVFEVKVDSEDSVSLHWLVTEYNNKSFWVEHSTDGINWSVVATIPSKNSAESLEAYSFKHANRQDGRHYYRVKHQDINDFKVGFSMVRVINITHEKKETIRIVPNPATDNITINNSMGEYSEFTIVDLFGKVMLHRSLPAQSLTVPIDRLPSGTYLVSLKRMNKGVESQRIVKL